MIRRPPRSPPFPYPTLFRSHRGHRRLKRIHGGEDGGRGTGLSSAATRGLAPEPVGPALPPPFRDRKSTRLNSSHANISYAVFCLKKKQQIDIRIGSM